MPYCDPHTHEKQADCLQLYLKYGGRDHDKLEREMRQMGWENFSRRILYSRNQRGKHVSGWIEKLGWHAKLVEHFDEATGGIPVMVRSTIERAVKRAKFHDWLKEVTPNYQWDAAHHKYICEQLEKVDSGECKRLMIFVPPRHGKSELVTVRYAAWTLKNDPSQNVIIGSYGQTLANRFSRKVKRVLTDDWAMRREKNSPPYEGGVAAASADGVVLSAGESTTVFSPMNVDIAAGHATVVPGHNSTATVTFTSASSFVTTGCASSFTDPNRRHGGGTAGGERDAQPPVEECPFPFVSTRPKNSEAEWETSKGGGLRAVGVGAGITGFGANLIIVDDPVKSRAEAESKAQREAVWDWFNDDLYTRLEPDGKVILIQTRWHEDDLAGRLLRKMNEGEGEEWTVVNLPAIATGARASCPPVEPGVEDKRSRGAIEPFAHDRSHASTHSVGSAASVSPSLPISSSLSLSDTGGQDARAPVKRVIGFPRLYSRLNDWSASVPLANAGSSGVTATGSVNPDMNEVATDTELIDGNVHYAGGTGVGKRDACAPVTEPVDQIERQPGQPLWPQRFSLEKLEQRQQQLGTYSFSALYQQNPVPAEGGMFKRAWFDRIISAPPPGLRWIRGYDLAASAGSKADFTASFRVAFDRDENMYIDGGFRRRMEYPEMRRYILQRIASESNTEHCIEASLNAKPVLQDIKTERAVRGKSLREITVRESKTSRALSWVNLAEQGRVFLVRGAWNEEFIDECCSFPLGTHDDQVDAVSLAVKARRSVDNRLHRF